MLRDQQRFVKKIEPFWSAAAWRRFVIDSARPRSKRRQAAALQGGASFRNVHKALRLRASPGYIAAP